MKRLLQIARIAHRRFRRPLSLAIVCTGFVPLPSHADGPGNITDAEWGLLPKYCYYTQLSPGQRDVATTQSWYEQMGRNNFHATHHYCWGLIWAMRAERARHKVKQFQYEFMLEKVVSEMTFTLRHSERTYVIRPEILTRQARALKTLKRYEEAAQGFNEALELKPDYWPASVGLAETLLESGKISHALEVVDQALKLRQGIPQLTQLRAEIMKVKSGK